MKKLFTLCTAMLLAAMAQAQVDETFQFVDADGNVVADGSTIVVNQVSEEGQMVIPLWVKKTSDEKAAVSLYETIDQMPGGEWQTCAFGSCMPLTESGYSPKQVVDGEYNAKIETEWIPGEGNYPTWEATLQIHVFSIVSKTQFGVVTDVVGTEVIGYGPTVTVRFEPQQEKAKVWWGYVGADDQCDGLGTSKAVTYDCAAYFSGKDKVAGGKTICAVRFMLMSSNVKDVKVWIAETKPDSIKNAIQVVSVEDPVIGINEVTLPTPYTIGEKGVYVGYSFTITKLSTQADAYPVAITGSDLANSLLLRTSSDASWQDLNGQGFGRLYLQMLLEGDFLYKNAVSIGSSNLGESVVLLGGSTTTYMPVTNEGTNNLQSFDYTITVDGETGPEQHFELQDGIAFGSTRSVVLEVSGDEEPGQKVKTLTITKANGVPNEMGEKKTKYTMSTVAEQVHRGIAVEEFTGTTCGWCPRGIVGMEKLRREFPDNFVGIAIHRYTQSSSSDAMYCSAYSHVSFDGAPSCRLDRGPVIDPYYGSGYDIIDDFRAELAIPAKVAVDVKGKWTADSSKVEATATLTSVMPGGDFKIEYVLIADSLSGTTQAWRQYNYYNKAYGMYESADDMPSDLAFLYDAGKVFNNQYAAYYPVFNDVAFAVAKTAQTTAPGVLTMGEPTTNTCTLSMPTNSILKKAIKKKNVAVIALVIDKGNNRIANAAKYYIRNEESLVGDVNGDGTVDVADISAVISHMAGTESYANADVNGDNSVDVADISAIITIMANQ